MCLTIPSLNQTIYFLKLMVALGYFNLNKLKYFDFSANVITALDAKYRRQAGAKLTRHLSNDRLRFPLSCS